jgi:ferritin-like protein
MQESGRIETRHPGRRAFLKSGVLAGAATISGTGFLATALPALGREPRNGRLTEGDASILRFLAAAEILESDLWIQYNELGGEQDSEVPGQTGGSPPYKAALNNLDADMSQYVHDNTEDEISHFTFINAYLKSKGAEGVNLDEFRTLPSSKATGARQIGRLTNLMQLTVDTSWWVRYRSRANNPDLDRNFVFANAVPSLAMGQHPAIPRTDDDLTPQHHIQAIANTAAFHFAFIEQGGTSLYPSLAQRVSNPEVLRILLSIGPTETAHFQTWHDKAGNAVSDPLAPLTDPKDTKLVFPNLNLLHSEDFQTNLIMPEPCPFLSRKFPVVSIIRPTNTKGAAMGAAAALTADGLFRGQSKAFFDALRQLAHEADEARPEEER